MLLVLNYLYRKFSSISNQTIYTNHNPLLNPFWSQKYVGRNFKMSNNIKILLYKNTAPQSTLIGCQARASPQCDHPLLKCARSLCWCIGTINMRKAPFSSLLLWQFRRTASTRKHFLFPSSTRIKRSERNPPLCHTYTS